MKFRVLRFVRRINNSALIHGGMAVVWALMLVPTVLWWKDSILWVSGMSLYAIVVAHLSALEAALAKAEVENT